MAEQTEIGVKRYFYDQVSPETLKTAMTEDATKRIKDFVLDPLERHKMITPFETSFEQSRQKVSSVKDPRWLLWTETSFENPAFLASLLGEQTGTPRFTWALYDGNKPVATASVTSEGISKILPIEAAKAMSCISEVHIIASRVHQMNRAMSSERGSS